MFARILSAFILFSCFSVVDLQAQNKSTQYEVYNTWDYATEEIEEFPFIVGNSLIQALKINSVAIIVKRFPMGKALNKEENNTSFGGLIAFNKEGLTSFSSDQKVVDWEKHRPTPTDRNILVPKKDNYFPIRHGTLYYTYLSKNHRTVSFFFEERSDSLPDRYSSCSVRRSTDRYRSPHHLLPQRVLPETPEIPVNKTVKEDGRAVTYHYEKTDKGFTETITNDSQKNLYNHKKQLVSTYEMTNPFRIYIEEYFYTYNERGLVTKRIRLYEDTAGGFTIRDSTLYEYNAQGQLIKSLRNTGVLYYDETYRPHEKIQADYYYNSKGLLDRKVISDLTMKVRFVCIYIYNPSAKAIMEMP
jgi:hypothetical protein